MNKQEFLSRLEQALSGLPQEELQERLAFFRESIEDRLEEGLSEEAAVEELGPVEEVAAQILAETPFPTLVREKIRSRGPMPIWEILLLVLGFPLWFPLLVTAFALLLSAFIVLWSLILCLWAVELSLIAGALGALVTGVLSLFRGEPSNALLMMGAGLMLAGLSVFLFFGCKAASKGAVALTGKTALWLKSLFLRKERKS